MIKKQPFSTIFKKSKTGAAVQWHQEIEGSKFRTVSGQINGKLVISAWTQCKGKNIGRSNERTPEDQALFKMEAARKKKLEKDYHEFLTDINKGSHILPCMLAYSYKDSLKRKNPVNISECYSQSKLNGMRCLINKDGMWSRKGKPIVSCPHIFEVLKPIFEKNPNLILDGEGYTHQFHDNFEELMSIFKRLKPKSQDLEKSKEFAQYHVYDLNEQNGYKFSERFNQLRDIVEEINSPYVQLVKTDKIKSKEHLDELYKEYLSENYEGQMIREDVHYKDGRSWGLLKRKEFLDEEFELIDILEGEGNWSGKAKSALLKLSDGRTFNAGITGTMEFTAELLKNKEKYIGKMTTVNFFQYTSDNVPLFPRVKEWDRIDV